jgi:hypothetical protein
MGFIRSLAILDTTAGSSIKCVQHHPVANCRPELRCTSLDCPAAWPPYSHENDDIMRLANLFSGNHPAG